MAKPLLVLNWKANPKTVKEAANLFSETKKKIAGSKNIETVICPPFPYLTFLKPLAQKIKLGAQDCFWEEAGPYTGEVSAAMLKDLGADYVIVGHSERRLLGETNKITAKKAQAALKAGLKTIVCVGETAKERKKGAVLTALKKQLIESLDYCLDKKLVNLLTRRFVNLIIAYEPVWAVVSDDACAWQEAERIRQAIKKILKKIFKQKSARITILYGGSVDSKNAADYLKKAGFNGLLIGNSSLNPREVRQIFKSIT